MLLGIGFILIACAQPPIEEMNRAIQALDRAENDVGALVYAPNYLSRAREALEKMQEEADSKRFDSAKRYAAEVIANADRAISEGSIAAARARNEAYLLLNGLSDPMAETLAHLDTAKQVQDIPLDFFPLEEMMEIAQVDFESAQQSYSNGDYPDALDRGETVRSIISDVNVQISQAALATSLKN